MSASALLWGLLFGSVGLALFVYGKKQGAIVPLVCGLLLLVIPYVLPNTVLLVIVGAALVATPFVIRR